MQTTRLSLIVPESIVAQIDQRVEFLQKRGRITSRSQVIRDILIKWAANRKPVKPIQKNNEGEDE